MYRDVPSYVSSFFITIFFFSFLYHCYRREIFGLVFDAFGSSCSYNLHSHPSLIVYNVSFNFLLLRAEANICSNLITISLRILYT